MSVQASKRPVEITIVYLTGLAHGLGLVTFPAGRIRTGSFLGHGDCRAGRSRGSLFLVPVALDTPCAAYHDAWGLS